MILCQSAKESGDKSPHSKVGCIGRLEQAKRSSGSEQPKSIVLPELRFACSSLHRAIMMTLALAVAAAPAAELLAADNVSVGPREKWSSVFGGTDVKYTYVVTGDRAVAGNLSWSFSINRRTISRGEMPLQADGGSGQATIELRVPPVKDGVVIAAQLVVAVNVKGAKTPAAVSERTIWMFPKNAFHDRSEWLKSLKISLFDPEGDTVGVFDDAEIPYERIRNLAVLEDIKEGLLVVGEGVSLEDNDELRNEMVTLAARGIPVLCLAPKDGSMLLPGSNEEDRPVTKSVRFQREDVITQLDKQLDSRAWAPDGKLVASRLAIKSDDDQVVAAVTDSPRGWPWLEVRYPQANTAFVVCGFGIIEHWEAGPTPRFLLARLFEYVTERPKKDVVGLKDDD